MNGWAQLQWTRKPKQVILHLDIALVKRELNLVHPVAVELLLALRAAAVLGVLADERDQVERLLVQRAHRGERERNELDAEARLQQLGRVLARLGARPGVEKLLEVVA